METKRFIEMCFRLCIMTTRVRTIHNGQLILTQGNQRVILETYENGKYVSASIALQALDTLTENKLFNVDTQLDAERIMND